MAEQTSGAPRKADATDYKHRARVNLIAGIAIVVLVAAGWYSAKIFFEHEKLDACISSGRKTCVDMNVPKREGVYIPAR